MRKEAEVLRSSESAEGRKIVNKYMLDAERQQGQTLSFYHTSFHLPKKQLSPLLLKQDASASAVENSTRQNTQNMSDASLPFQSFI